MTGFFVGSTFEPLPIDDYVLATRSFRRKPVYNAIANALKSYNGGDAFVIRNSWGNERLRFLSNGNVAVLEGAVVAGNGVLPSAGVPSTAKEFIISDAAGTPKAVLKPDGNLYIAGSISQNVAQSTLESYAASNKAFEIRDASGAVRSLIDKFGNLKMRGVVISNPQN